MDVQTELTITVKVDTSSARQEVSDFQSYALRVLEEIRAAYASAGSTSVTENKSSPGISGLSSETPDTIRRA